MMIKNLLSDKQRMSDMLSIKDKELQRFKEKVEKKE